LFQALSAFIDFARGHRPEPNILQTRSQDNLT
jgi:hypothetical protein